MVFAFTSATMTDPAARGTRTSHQFSQSNFCTLTNFWLRDKLYRDTAQVLLRKKQYRDNFTITLKVCTTTRVMLSQLCTWTAKTHAIPSLHRDSLPVKVPGSCSALTSGNTNALYCRAVMRNSLNIR